MSNGSHLDLEDDHNKLRSITRSLKVKLQSLSDPNRLYFKPNKAIPIAVRFVTVSFEALFMCVSQVMWSTGFKHVFATDPAVGKLPIISN